MAAMFSAEAWAINFFQQPAQEKALLCPDSVAASETRSKYFPQRKRR
jgi:hypothetical protein